MKLDDNGTVLPDLQTTTPPLSYLPFNYANLAPPSHACPVRVPFWWELRRFALLVERVFSDLS
jgi:hypothetical protein